MKAWPLLAIAIIQVLLFIAHWFLFRTVIAFWSLSPVATLALRAALFLLAFSFILAALLSFRYGNLPVRILYKFAAVWLGFLNFFFYAACLCWLAGFALLLSPFAPHLPQIRPLIATVLFSVAALAGIYGLVNARILRIRRITVHLPNLPAVWRGRKALLFSDLHLGHVLGLGFCRRVVALAARLNPDIVFVPGDFYDGTKDDPESLAAPFRELSPPLGIYFSAGNHDEFGNIRQHTHALTRAGVHVLSNEKVTIDGLQIIGIPYHDTTFPLRMHATLERLHIDPAHASILLNHAPHRLPIVEQAGISLQLSGHTHGGQLFPNTWFTQRIFGKFTHGLHSFGKLQVFTSYGAGTWGPPMRVGTHPEVVLLTFE